MTLPNNFKEDFEKKGYTIVKSVFTPSEIDELKRLVLLSEKELSSAERILTAGATKTATTPIYYSSKDDLLSNPYLRHIVYDDRLLTIVKNLLGSDKIVYTAEGSWSIHRNTHTSPMLFHKDNSDRINGNGPDWTNPFHLIRIGIYLQDHSKHSGGLSVFEGSHSIKSIKDGKVVVEWGKRVYLKTQPGDVVIWYLKTSHAGDWGIPKIPLIDLLPLKIIRKLHRFEFLFKSQPHLRSAIFLSYGIKGESTERYKQYLRVRKWSFDMAQNSHFDSVLAEKLKKEKNLEVFNLKEIMNGVKPEDVGEHRDIPF